MIKELKEYNTDIVRLLSQLSDVVPNKEHLVKFFSNENNRMFGFFNNDKIVGIASLVCAIIPSRNKYWIEDIVVDEDYRGRGIGKLLTKHIIDNIDNTVYLTSSVDKVVANKMYQSIGFTKRETNVYYYN